MACWIHEYGDWFFKHPVTGERDPNVQYKQCWHCGHIKKRII